MKSSIASFAVMLIACSQAAELAVDAEQYSQYSRSGPSPYSARPVTYTRGGPSPSSYPGSRPAPQSSYQSRSTYNGPTSGPQPGYGYRTPRQYNSSKPTYAPSQRPSAPYTSQSSRPQYPQQRQPTQSSYAGPASYTRSEPTRTQYAPPQRSQPTRSSYQPYQRSGPYGGQTSTRPEYSQSSYQARPVGPPTPQGYPGLQRSSQSSYAARPDRDPRAGPVKSISNRRYNEYPEQDFSKGIQGWQPPTGATVIDSDEGNKIPQPQGFGGGWAPPTELQGWGVQGPIAEELPEATVDEVVEETEPEVKLDAYGMPVEEWDGSKEDLFKAPTDYTRNPYTGQYWGRPDRIGRGDREERAAYSRADAYQPRAAREQYQPSRYADQPVQAQDQGITREAINPNYLVQAIPQVDVWENIDDKVWNQPDVHPDHSDFKYEVGEDDWVREEREKTDMGNIFDQDGDLEFDLDAAEGEKLTVEADEGEVDGVDNVDLLEQQVAEDEAAAEEKLEKEAYMTKEYYMPGYVDTTPPKEYPPHIRAFKNYISSIGDFQKHGYEKKDYSPDSSGFAPDSSGFGPDSSEFRPNVDGFAPRNQNYVPEYTKESYVPDYGQFRPEGTDYRPEQGGFDSFRPDLESYRPAQGSYRPAPGSYRPEQASYRPQAQSYAPGPQSYRPQAQSYAPGAQSYRPQTQSYGPGPQSYRPQAQSYGPGPQSYRPQTQSYSPGPQSYSPQSQRGYNTGFNSAPY